MTSMDSTQTTGRAARAAAVLAVLLGLLAMHGLASPHHAAAASTPTHAAATAGAHVGPAHHDVPMTSADAMPAVREAAQALAAPPMPAGGGDHLGVVALCVSVLTGAALALLLARRRRTPVVLAPARHAVRPPAPPARHARGPDPVRELCVSRT